MKKLPRGFSRTKDGIYCYRFQIEKKRYAVYGKTIAECKEKELAKREQIKQAKEKEKILPTLDEYYDQWIAGKAGTVKETTIRSNRMMYQNIGGVEIGGQKFGGMVLDQIEAKHVKALQTALRNKGKATRTVNDTVCMLSSILQTAVNERLIQWNAAKAIKPLRRTEEKATENIHRALTKQETDAFIEAAKSMGSWYTNLYIFLLNTGTRVGEAGAITKFNIRDGKVEIQRTITRTDGGSYIIGDSTKTEAGERYIPLNLAAETALKDQQALNIALDAKSAGMPIFRTVRGTLLKASIVNTDIAKVCKAAGIERFGVHAFRDSFATRCAESGMDIQQLKKILGHNSLEMTLGLYVHSNDERMAEQLRAVNF